MKFTSTRDHQYTTDFKDAMLHGLAPDHGLYVPCSLPRLPEDFLEHLKQKTLDEIGVVIMRNFLDEIPEKKLHELIRAALNFPIPLVHLEKNYYLLEVFHGPTLSFKDVGARFMAQVMEYFMALENRRVKILVATSGDTGSAIAHAFQHAPHIDVYILYPSEKISRLQEMQITTFGGNIHALEVTGTFDDCQRLVKTGLADESLRTSSIVTTSNSINIARLLPQMIYHAFGLAQLMRTGMSDAPVMSVPSGNLGNLTSAVYAAHSGFSVNHFISALNINSVFADYLTNGKFEPQPSRKSFANAMDVGNPSNFERLRDLYAKDYHRMQREITGISIDDEHILAEIRQTYEKTNYILDPHTAVGVAAARKYDTGSAPILITATANPAKFPEVIKKAIHQDIELPETLRQIISKPKQAIKIGTDYSELQTLLKQA